MTRIFSTLVFIFIVIFGITLSAHAALVNWGHDGKYFHDTDTDTGLYWMDSDEFVGSSYNEINSFVTASSVWKWATSAEIDNLSGKSSLGGIPLTEVMGPHQFQTFFYDDQQWYYGSRWIGYYDNTPAQPDGWVIQTYFDAGPPVINDLSTLDEESGWQMNVDNWTHGAWINSNVNPVPIPGAAWLFASGLTILPFLRKKWQKA